MALRGPRMVRGRTRRSHKTPLQRSFGAQNRLHVWQCRHRFGAFWPCLPPFTQHCARPLPSADGVHAVRRSMIRPRHEHAQTIPDHGVDGRSRNVDCLPQGAADRHPCYSINNGGRTANLWHGPGVRSTGFAIDVCRSGETRAGDDDARRARDGGRELETLHGAVSRTACRTAKSTA